MRIRQNSIEYNHIQRFNSNGFRNPAIECWPVYGWVWNGDIDQVEIERQIDLMCRHKIKTMYILPEPTDFRPVTMCTYMNPDYLTAEYLTLYRHAVLYAQEKGMQVWMYDEAGWPSGSANGEVVHKNPGLIRKYIRADVKTINAGERYLKPDGVLAVFDPNHDTLPDPYTPASDEEITEYAVTEWKAISLPYPDLLNPKTTQEFIRCTHERYKAAVGDRFGPTLQVTFTDEPSISSAPWSDGLDDAFERRYGYSFLLYLPAIVSSAEMGEAGKQARVDFCDLCGELFAQNYFRGLQDWCHANGILSTGHLNGEDVTLGCVSYGYVNSLRLLRCFDIPGIDVIWRQIFPGKKIDYTHSAPTNPFFPRFASSAANQTTSYSKMTESFGVYGAGMTYDQMRYVLNAQAVRGINLFNPLLLSLTQKDHFRGGERPNFPPEAPGAEDKAVFHEYAARISYLTSLGAPEARTALYIPLCDFWAKDHEVYIAREFERIGLTMEQAQCEFDVIDDDAILAADEDALGHGVLKLGLAHYDEVWFPPCRHLPDAVRVRLERFIRGGGVLYAVKGDFNLDIEWEIITEEIAGRVRPLMKCTPAHPEILAMRRKTSDGDIYFLFNESAATVSARLTFDDSRPVFMPNLLTGDIDVPNTVVSDSTTSLDISLYSGEMRVFCFTARLPEEAKPEPNLPDRLYETPTVFGFRRVRSFAFGEHLFESHDIREPEITVSCGDWQAYAGKEFSGDGVYSFTLAKPDAERIKLDFGTVNYSCELFINGKSYGVRCMMPYSYILPACELEALNRIELRVSNTPANQFVYTHAFDHYTEGEIGPYHKRSLEYEKDSLVSGLLGPVRILV